MAKLRIFKTIENDVYKVTLLNDVTSLSENDRQLMSKYGEPEINVGGTFLATTGNEYTLPDQYVKIKNGMQPLVMTFDARSTPFNTNTVVKVTAFVDSTITKFDDAFTTLRAEDDTFSGEQIHEV